MSICASLALIVSLSFVCIVLCENKLVFEQTTTSSNLSQTLGQQQTTNKTAILINKTSHSINNSHEHHEPPNKNQESNDDDKSRQLSIKLNCQVSLFHLTSLKCTNYLSLDM